jgi:hypothetical protein
VRSAIAKAIDPARASAATPLTLALDIERALQNSEVRELMERLARDSAALAAQDRGDEVVPE